MADEFDEAEFRARAVREINDVLHFTNWSAARLAREIGVAPSTITRALDPSTAYSPSTRTMQRLRKLASDLSDDLKGESIAKYQADIVEIRADAHRQGRIPVMGTLQNEVWRHVSDNSEPKEFLNIFEPRYGDRPLFALKVEGRETDREFDDGVYVIVVPTKFAALFEGDVVVVRYVSNSRQMTVLMDLEATDGAVGIVSRTVTLGDPRAEAVEREMEPLEGELEIRRALLGVVVASYRPLNRNFGRPIAVPEHFLQFDDWSS